MQEGESVLSVTCGCVIKQSIKCWAVEGVCENKLSCAECVPWL